jgi:hypothetical protein
VGRRTLGIVRLNRCFWLPSTRSNLLLSAPLLTAWDPPLPVSSSQLIQTYPKRTTERQQRQQLLGAIYARLRVP